MKNYNKLFLICVVGFLGVQCGEGEDSFVKISCIPPCNPIVINAPFTLYEVGPEGNLEPRSIDPPWINFRWSIENQAVRDVVVVGMTFKVFTGGASGRDSQDYPVDISEFPLRPGSSCLDENREGSGNNDISALVGSNENPARLVLATVGPSIPGGGCDGRYYESKMYYMSGLPAPDRGSNQDDINNENDSNDTSDANYFYTVEGSVIGWFEGLTSDENILRTLAPGINPTACEEDPSSCGVPELTDGIHSAQSYHIVPSQRMTARFSFSTR